jgi:polysaccharide biosynthesis protein PslF
MRPRKPIRVIYVSTYIPQKCGIATFTKDVTTAINMLNPHALAEIMAVTKPKEKPRFPWEVKFKISQCDLDSYLQAARYINRSTCDLVLIEHEFGVFGGNCGEYLVPFLEKVRKPKIMTCHTVIDNSKNDWGQLFKKLVKNVDGLIVMTNKSAKNLADKYNIERSKITVIPHGTPNLTYGSTEPYKNKERLSGKLILGNINLLSENKGIDYALEAVAEIVKVYPNVLYLIIGQTHPNILEREGERYRNHLKQRIRELGIGKNVRFINRYVSLEELIDWLKVIDIYITPYLDPQQSSSGALAYAIGAGKLCISTKYQYAKETLADGRGILVPFKDASAISRAVINTWKDETKREEIQKKAYDYGRFMTWSNVALQHLDLFAEVIKGHHDKSNKSSN